MMEKPLALHSKNWSVMQLFLRIIWLQSILLMNTCASSCFLLQRATLWYLFVWMCRSSRVTTAHPFSWDLPLLLPSAFCWAGRGVWNF